jgi:adhesin/invasin
MLSVAMIPRTRIAFAILFAAGALTVACQRVPLLAPSGSTITLTSAATALPLNGSAEIIAQVIEASGTPPNRGTLITFTTTLGAVQPFEAETDVNGRVVVKFAAGNSSGTATITASSGGANVGTAGAIKIAIGTAAVGRVSVNANPASVPAIGGSTTITAAVFDVNGNPLSSAPVTFSTTAGSLSASTVGTDANGIANTTLTTSQQATVTASVGAQAPPATGGGTTTTPAASGQASGTVIVTVSAAPTLVITPLTNPISAGLPATFTFTTTAPASGGVVRNVAVNWGDNRTQDLGALNGTIPVTHAYQSAGSYVITATLTDSLGNVVPVSTTVVVNARPQPVVTLTTTTPNPTAGTDITFTASVAPAAATNTVIDDVTIDYGDGTKTSLGPVTGTGIVLHHVYQSGGTYTVTLRATDSNGGVGTAVTTVFVQSTTPLGVTLNASATIGTVTTVETFTATVTGLGNSVVVSYLWEFGNGDPPQTTTTNQITHSYAHGSGTFTARVTITTSTAATATNTTVITP